MLNLWRKWKERQGRKDVHKWLKYHVRQLCYERDIDQRDFWAEFCGVNAESRVSLADGGTALPAVQAVFGGKVYRDADGYTVFEGVDFTEWPMDEFMALLDMAPSPSDINVK